MAFSLSRTRSGCNRRFWVACASCALGLAACNSNDEPIDRESGGSGGVVTITGGREGGTAGRDALGGSAGTGLGGASTGTGGGGGGAQGGADSSSGGASGGQAGTPGAAGTSNGGEDDSAGGETETGGAAGGSAVGGAGGAGGAGSAGSASHEGPRLNGCTTYVDRTAPSASRTLPWDAAIAVSPERCLKIRVDQEVVFDGDFDAHPIESSGGDSPSPFSTTPLAFARPGVFGYACTVHSEMTGAIWVVP